MVRPHPAVWRLVHGMMVCYLMFLVFMLFQNLDDARQFLRVSHGRVRAHARVGVLAHGDGREDGGGKHAFMTDLPQELCPATSWPVPSRHGVERRWLCWDQRWSL